jgi:hypothetical protein
MSRVTLDQSLRSKLNDLESQTEICDEAGQIVGYYVPATWHRKMLYAWAKIQFTDDELEMARQQAGGRSLSAILADLEKQ